MRPKVQTENTKLAVPGPGNYESPSKVSSFYHKVDSPNNRFALCQIVESQGKSMGVKYDIKVLSGKLGPGPGGYEMDNAKKQDFSYS